MNDTIAALSTGNCISAIGILRLSGPESAQIGGRIFAAKSGKALWEAPNRKLIMGT